MAEIVILGKNRDYLPIDTDLVAVSREFLKMTGITDPQKLLEGLVQGSLGIDAVNCSPYGGTHTLDIAGRTDNLQTDIVDFFKQAQAYGDQHKADYVEVQDFGYNITRSSRRISASLQLLLAGPGS